ncbi:MAG: hypothetical protein HFI53_12975 [Lachnospiraceae bacterium]|nr:hypothetical protein [Lachnospiraceae bacterium]
MRYFSIYADKCHIQPRILNRELLIRPHIQEQRLIYEELENRNYLKVGLEQEVEFLDIVNSPIFMVTKGVANLIRVYCPAVKFKYMVLFDETNRRAVSYQIPALPEIDCLHDDSELSRDGNTITKGILCGEKTGNVPIFRLKGAKGRYIMANLAFVESAYRREVRGMGIEEFVVQ